MSIPSEETNKAVSERLVNDIVNGVYDIGTLIVPQEFQKTTVKEVSWHQRKLKYLDVNHS